MKKIIFIAILGISISGCTEKTNSTIRSSELEDYRVTADDPIYDIILNPDRNTLEALDEYYLEVIKTRSDELRFDNLRKVIISHMYLKRDEFLKEMEKEKLEYYTNEILSMEYISNMEMLADMIVNLSGHWDDEKIRSISRMAHDRNIKYIRENFDDTQKIYDNPKQGYGVLRLKHLSKYSSKKD